MSWLFSRALVDRYLPVNLSDGAQCAQWSPMPTARPFLYRDKTTEACPFSRYGVTCEPLTDGLGEGLLNDDS